MTQSTRFLMAIGVMTAYLVEAILKAILTTFPFVELVAAQGLVAAGYFAVRTVTGMQETRLGVCPPQDPGPGGTNG